MPTSGWPVSASTYRSGCITLGFVYLLSFPSGWVEQLIFGRARAHTLGWCQRPCKALRASRAGVVKSW